MTAVATVGRSDLRDARCAECGARCVPGDSHLEHNAGWRKKVLMWDWIDIALSGYPGWDLVDPGNGDAKHPPCVRLAIRNGTDKDSLDIDREFDAIAVGQFHSEDLPREGSVFVRKGEVYDAKWSFQKREDAYKFVRLYGGIT